MTKAPMQLQSARIPELGIKLTEIVPRRMRPFTIEDALRYHKKGEMLPPLSLVYVLVTEPKYKNYFGHWFLSDLVTGTVAGHAAGKAGPVLEAKTQDGWTRILDCIPNTAIINGREINPRTETNIP
ncbi:MAG: hypothetical protein V1909_02080, partial [Candidatus Micrarchaeota archaeon]